MKTTIWDPRKIQKELAWRCQNMEKSTILECFLGILKSLEEKRPQIANPKKIFSSHFTYASNWTTLS